MPTARSSVLVLAIACLGLLLPIGVAKAQPTDATPTGSICDVVPLPAGTPEAGGQAMHGAEASATDAAATPDLAVVPFDLAFVDLMIAHHEGAVVMAEIARGEATRPELRTLAEGIVTTQTAEIAQLREWRDAWYPGADEPPAAELTAAVNAYAATMLDATPVPGMVGMDAGAEVVALCAAAATGGFDLAFVDRMIPHHEGTVALANVALEQAEHAELKTLANAIIDAQQAEIEQMREWRAAWA